MAMEFVFIGSIKSNKNPERSGSIAVGELEPVNKPAPVLDGSPSEYKKKDCRDEKREGRHCARKADLEKGEVQNAMRKQILGNSP